MKIIAVNSRLDRSSVPGMGIFRWKYVFIAVLSITVSSGAGIRAEAQDTEFNTLLFQTTFKIEGPAEPRGVTLGTVFLMSRPIPESAKFRTVLITHVMFWKGSEAIQRYSI